MTIQIDLELIKSIGLSVAEWTALVLIHQNQTGYILDVCDPVDFDKLEDAGWMKMAGDDMDQWAVRSKFLDLVQSKGDTMWYQLCSHLPFKVPGKGGYRVLRAKDPDARSNDKARKKYLAIVKGNKPLHDKIIECVKIQVRTTDIAYMQNLETWINQRTWEKYEDQLITSVEEKETTKYGGGLI